MIVLGEFRFELFINERNNANRNRRGPPPTTNPELPFPLQELGHKHNLVVLFYVPCRRIKPLFIEEVIGLLDVIKCLVIKSKSAQFTARIFLNGSLFFVRALTVRHKEQWSGDATLPRRGSLNMEDTRRTKGKHFSGLVVITVTDSFSCSSSCCSFIPFLDSLNSLPSSTQL